MADKKKVVVTGFGGRIGKVLRDHLGDKYEFSGIDRVPLDGLDSLTADLTDLEAITPAFQGKDVVIHLAAEPRHTPDIGWDLLMPDNVIATANVFEAARAGGVSRIIFFSSMHVVGMYERDQPYKAIAEGDYGDLDPDTVPLITHEMPDRPDGPYAVSKIFGEALGRYFWEDHRISVICIRFGTTAPDDRPGSDARSLVSYFSHRDIAAMVEACIEAERRRLRHLLRRLRQHLENLRHPPRLASPRLSGAGQRRILQVETALEYLLIVLYNHSIGSNSLYEERKIGKAHKHH